MSGKCFCSPGAPMAAAGGTLSTGHHSRCVRLLCCSPAPHGALLARDGVPVGTAQARESLTQDSRSAVKARLVDPLRESFGEERCAPCRADESLTQDSRSAVKARLIDPLRESFGEERCAPRGDGVRPSKRP